MSDDIINYDEMVQVALIGVVRDILIDTKKNGLPGEHHFYITFQTTHWKLLRLHNVDWNYI